MEKKRKPRLVLTIHRTSSPSNVMNKDNKEKSQACGRDKHSKPSPNNKSRTPSGNTISVKIGDIRTIFSPDRYQVCEKEFLKINHPYQQRLRNSSSRSSGLNRSSDHTGKPGVTSIRAVKTNNKTQTVSAIKDTSKSASGNRVIEEEADNYFTPPATPIRKLRQLRSSSQSNSPDQRITKFLNRLGMSDDTAFRSLQSTTELIEENTSGTSEVENMETNAPVEEIMTMDLPTVLAMFKRIEDRLSKIENKDYTCNTENKNVEQRLKLLEQQSDNGEQVSALKHEIKLLKRENFLLDRAAKMSLTTIDQLVERVSKLELNNSRKTVSINGLYVYSDKKEEIVKEIEAFIEYELELIVKIDDAYTIGTNNPPTCIVMFSTLQEKREVMLRKSLLKHVHNKSGGSIFINNYLQTEANERRKMEKDLLLKNEAMQEEHQRNMSFQKGILMVENTPAQEVKEIKVPNPTQILDLNVDDLNEILRIAVTRGTELCKEGSRYIGYAASVETFQQIRDIYLKIKLTHPAAHHVICAYLLEKEQRENHPFGTGFCDDGEHGGGRVLLDYMNEQHLQNRVIFIVRYYGGVKLGADRFTYIIRAASSVLMNSPPPSIESGTPPKQFSSQSTAGKPINQTQQNLQNETVPKPPIKKGFSPSNPRGHSFYGANKSHQRGAMRSSTRGRGVYQGGRGRSYKNSRGWSRGGVQRGRGGSKRITSPSNYQYSQPKRQRSYSEHLSGPAQHDLSQEHYEHWSHSRDGNFDNN